MPDSSGSLAAHSGFWLSRSSNIFTAGNFLARIGHLNRKLILETMELKNVSIVLHRERENSVAE
jgi:hypothetical protein